MIKILFLAFVILCVSCNSLEKKLSISFENKINVKLDSIAINKSELKQIDNFHFNCSSANYSINADSTLSLIYLVDTSYLIDYNISNRKINRIKINGQSIANSGNATIIKGQKKYSLLSATSEFFNINSEDSLQNNKFIINSLFDFKNRNIIVSSELGFGYRIPNYNDSNIIISVIDLESRKTTFAKFNLFKKETIFFQFKFHNDFFNYFHPLRNGIKMETYGDTLIVNYQFTEKIDLFSIKSGKYIGSKNLKSKYQLKSIPYLRSIRNDFENDRYPVEADYYDGLTYNPYKKCYYRLYYHTLPRFNENNDYTISDDKILSVVIFDQNFNWIGEQIVQYKDYFAGIVPHPDGALSLWGDKYGDNYYLKILKHD